LGAPAVLAGLFMLAALISVTSSNAAAAVILSPVAVRAAEPLGLTPAAALLTVAYGCSCAFIVPFAHQCNLMVAKPGGYSTRDFLVVGSGLSLVVAVVAVAMSTLLG
jgi:di/tricarboxylate transporter